MRFHGFRTLLRMLGAHGKACEFEAVQYGADAPFGQFHPKCRLDLGRKIHTTPAHHAVDLGIGTGSDPLGELGLLLRKQSVAYRSASLSR